MMRPCTNCGTPAVPQPPSSGSLCPVSYFTGGHAVNQNFQLFIRRSNPFQFTCRTQVVTLLLQVNRATVVLAEHLNFFFIHAQSSHPHGSVRQSLLALRSRLGNNCLPFRNVLTLAGTDHVSKKSGPIAYTSRNGHINPS